MANNKISQLPLGNIIPETLFPIVTSGITSQTTFADIQSAIGGLSDQQDNIVKTLTINNYELSGVGTIKEQICDYILALPTNERTILDTDSKWNVVLSFLRLFYISEEVLYCENKTPLFCDIIAYHNGVNELPQIGDTIYSDSDGIIKLFLIGTRMNTEENNSSETLVTDNYGKSITWSCSGLVEAPILVL